MKIIVAKSNQIETIGPCTTVETGLPGRFRKFLLVGLIEIESTDQRLKGAIRRSIGCDESHGTHLTDQSFEERSKKCEENSDEADPAQILVFKADLSREIFDQGLRKSVVLSHDDRIIEIRGMPKTRDKIDVGRRHGEVRFQELNLLEG